MVIDDLGRRHVCDLLLDQNFYRTPETRYAGKLPKSCRQLIGPRFALMRAEFAAARRTPRGGEVKCILVFIGGMDAGDVTSYILRALSEGLSGRPAINVAIGANHPQRAAIQAHCDAMDDWTCHVQTNHMAHLLAAADLVIGSGGTNTWERMTVGVPALALCIAENQRALLDECAATGLLSVPDDDALSDVALLRMHVNSMLKNQRQRHHFAVAGMALVDGLGAARVARAVAMLQPVVVRPATAADSDMLLAWRNHDSIRAVSRSRETIGRNAHRNWYERVLADPTRSLLVGECDRRPIGCVRFDEKAPDSAEISIFVAPDAIGAGAGTNLLAAAETWLERNRPHVATIDAEVLGGNVASTRLFERAGYQLDDVRYSKGLHI
jgi:spore coat polysaccharide biosynthesis predicted glycosyltransferase SpsG/L-amino acid N-acyltransferase YncA